VQYFVGCGGPHAEEVCHEMADVIARGLDRCQPGTYASNKTVVESGVGAAATCFRSAMKMRSAATAIPFLQTADCTKIQIPRALPASCKGQLS